MNGWMKKGGAAISGVAVIIGAFIGVDNRYAKAGDVGKALTDIHGSLQDLRIGQLQTRQAMLSRELFEYQLRDGRLTWLERQRQQAIRDEMRQLDEQVRALADHRK